MNNDTNQPKNNSSAQGLGLPPIPSVPTPPPPTPTPPVTTTTTTTIEPLTEVPSGLPPIEIKTETPAGIPTGPTPTTTTTTTIESKPETGVGLPPIEIKTEVASTPPGEKKPKKKVNKKLVIGGTLVALLIVGVVALASQLGVFTGEQRGRACQSCGGGTCPDGWSYGPDTCAPQATCDQRAQEACSGHQQAGTPTAAPTSGGGTPAPAGGCSGDLSHAYCKTCGNPGPCNAPDGTLGDCTVTTGTNCRWNPRQTCAPNAYDWGGATIGCKHCNSTGTAYLSGTVDQTLCGITPAPTATTTPGTGGGGTTTYTCTQTSGQTCETAGTGLEEFETCNSKNLSVGSGTCASGRFCCKPTTTTGGCGNYIDGEAIVCRNTSTGSSCTYQGTAGTCQLTGIAGQPGRCTCSPTTTGGAPACSGGKVCTTALNGNDCRADNSSNVFTSCSKSTGGTGNCCAVTTASTATGGAPVGNSGGSTSYVPPTTTSTQPPTVVSPNSACTVNNPSYNFNTATAKCTTPGVCTLYGECCGDGKSHTVQVTCLSDGREQYDIVSTCNESTGTLNCGTPKPGEVPGCPAGSFWWSISVGGDDKCHDISQQPNPGGGVGSCSGGKCTPQAGWCYQGFKCSPSELTTYTGFCLSNQFTPDPNVDYQQVANSECKTIQLDVSKRTCDLVTNDNRNDGGSVILSPNVSCTPTTTTPPPGTGTPPPGTAAACVNTRIFINSSTTQATAAEMNAIKIGDKLKMVVVGNVPAIEGARFDVKINGQVGNRSYLSTSNLTPIRTDGVKEYYYDYQITEAGAYTIEGYVNTVAPAATATPQPTAVVVVPPPPVPPSATSLPLDQGQITDQGIVLHPNGKVLQGVWLCSSLTDANTCKAYVRYGQAAADGTVNFSTMAWNAPFTLGGDLAIADGTPRAQAIVVYRTTPPTGLQGIWQCNGFDASTCKGATRNFSFDANGEIAWGAWNKGLTLTQAGLDPADGAITDQEVLIGPDGTIIQGVWQCTSYDGNTCKGRTRRPTFNADGTINWSATAWSAPFAIGGGLTPADGAVFAQGVITFNTTPKTGLQGVWQCKGPLGTDCVAHNRSISYPNDGAPVFAAWGSPFRLDGSAVAGASSDRAPLDILKETLLNTYKGIFKSFN